MLGTKVELTVELKGDGASLGIAYGILLGTSDGLDGALVIAAKQ